MSSAVIKSGKGPKEPHLYLEIPEALRITRETLPHNNLVRLIGQYEYRKGVHNLTNRLENPDRIEGLPLDLSMLDRYPPRDCGIEIFGALYSEPQPYVRVFFYSDLGYDVDLIQDYSECLRTVNKMLLS